MDRLNISMVRRAHAKKKYVKRRKHWIHSRCDTKVFFLVTNLIHYTKIVWFTSHYNKNKEKATGHLPDNTFKQTTLDCCAIRQHLYSPKNLRLLCLTHGSHDKEMNDDDTVDAMKFA